MEIKHANDSKSVFRSFFRAKAWRMRRRYSALSVVVWTNIEKERASSVSAVSPRIGLAYVSRAFNLLRKTVQTNNFYTIHSQRLHKLECPFKNCT